MLNLNLINILPDLLHLNSITLGLNNTLIRSHVRLQRRRLMRRRHGSSGGSRQPCSIVGLEGRRIGPTYYLYRRTLLSIVSVVNFHLLVYTSRVVETTAGPVDTDASAETEPVGVVI